MVARMRVLFIASHAVEFASTRFRIYQFLPYLERHGIECVVRPFLATPDALTIYRPGSTARKLAIVADATSRRLLDIGRATRFDIVYVMREAFPFGPPLIEHALKMAARRLIFDFDDAIWLPSSIYENPLDRLRDWQKPAKIMRIADHIIAGSALHVPYVAQYADLDRISVLPTVVDPQIYRPATARETDEITVGWIGTPRNTGYLRQLLPALEAAVAARPQLKFKFVGAEPFSCGVLPITFKPWRLDEEVADIQSFDIGIMPLPDDEHARGKCGFKLIQYMSCALPVICSPVGFNCELVEEDRSGRFATTSEEWIAAFVALVDHTELRHRLGSYGRQRIVERYSADVMAPRLLRILQETAAKSLERAAPAVG